MLAYEGAMRVPMPVPFVFVLVLEKEVVVCEDEVE